MAVKVPIGASHRPSARARGCTAAKILVVNSMGVVMGVSLKALVVDDDRLTRRLLYWAFQNADIRMMEAEVNEEAFKIINEIAASNLELDVITTDLSRPPSLSTGEGIDFIRKIRASHDEITLAGGLRLKHVPIIVMTGTDDVAAVREIPKIDANIPIFEKPFDEDEIVKKINELVRKYRNEILSGLQRVGMALVWSGGTYQVLDAYAQIPSSPVETSYIKWTAETHAYSRLVLIADRHKAARLALSQFESMLNDPHTTERDFQRFFELHPEFLLRDEYDSYWAEPVLKSPVDKRTIRPDFVLQPYARKAANWNWAVVDLKKPQVPLLSYKNFHMDLSRQVYRVATQLKDYADFFSDPRNHEVIKLRFGGMLPNPKLVAVIGRLPPEHKDQYAVLRSRLTGVSITTYDEILEFRRAKLERIEAQNRFT